MSQFVCKSKCHSEAVLQYSVALNNYGELPKECTDSLSLYCPGTPRNSSERICKSCAIYIKSRHESESSKKRKASSPAQVKNPPEKRSFEDILADIKNNDFTSTELNLIIREIGKKVGSDISKFVSNKIAENQERRLAEMTTSSEILWNSANSTVRSFFDGILEAVAKQKRLDISTVASNRRHGILHNTTQGLYASINGNYVSPTVLAEMLYIYFMSNSRSASSAHGVVTGAASFGTLQKAIADIGKSTPALPEKEYLVVAYDNNQVLGKTYRIQLRSKFHVTVVTTIAGFGLSLQDNPQTHNATFHNLQRLDTLAKRTVIQKVAAFRSNAKKAITIRVNAFWTTRINALNELPWFNGRDESWQDYVEINGQCPNERLGLFYDEVPRLGYSCKVYDQPCLSVNPNSYHGVAKALEEIQRSSINSSRKWVTVVADGLPYSLGLKVVEKWVNCTLCSASFMETDASEHYTDKHHHTVWPALPRKFTNILLRPGAGHFEINFLRAIFAEWFHIFIDPVAEMMGFTSPKAKLYCKSASDHHKSWQLFEVVVESLTDELCLAFLRHFYFVQKHPSTIIPTTEDFLLLINSTTNEYLKGVYQFLVSFCLPVQFFRAGVRQCNFEVTIMAREVASSVFYAFRHPKYQLINCVDIAELLQVPQHLRPAVYNESFRIPDSESGQGVDFLLEQRNRALKKFVVHTGVPTPDQWIQASRALPKLEEIVSSVETRLGLQRTISQTSVKYSLAEEKRAARNLFRKTGFFDFLLVQKFVAWNGEELSPDFRNCSERAEENQVKYYEDYILHSKAQVANYVLSNPSDKPLHAWTVARLREEIKGKAAMLAEDVRKSLLKGLATAKKDDLLQRYNRLVELVEQTGEADDDELLDV